MSVYSLLALYSLVIADQIKLFISIRIQIRFRIQEAKPMRILAVPDPDTDQTFDSEKLIFFMTNIHKVGKKVKTYLRRYKSFLKGRKSSFLVSFGQFPWSWIRIRIDLRIRVQDSKMNADPGGSGSTTPF